MKSKHDIKRSRDAQFKEVKKNHAAIGNIIQEIELEGFDGYLMGELRNKLNYLTKAVHEYSAYTNVLETGDE